MMRLKRYVRRQDVNQLTASFSALPGLKLGTLAALISIGCPVCGLRPVLAARSLTENTPKPTKETSPPFFNSAVIVSTTASKARPAIKSRTGPCRH